MLVETKFGLGDRVYAATAKFVAEYRQCEMCAGSGEWLATTASGETVPVGCPECVSAGKSTGISMVVEFRAFANLCVIKNVKASTHPDEGIRYQCEDCNSGEILDYPESDVFLTEKEALVRVGEKRDAELASRSQIQSRSHRKMRLPAMSPKDTVLNLCQKIAKSESIESAKKWAASIEKIVGRPSVNPF